MLSYTEEVVKIIKELPEITARELYEFVPHVSKGTVSSILHHLKNQGAVTTGTKVLPTKNGDRVFTSFTINPDPKPLAPKMKLKAPTEAGLQARLDAANAKIAELEQWKADAIARYPDLTVDPVIFKARKIVVAELKAAGDCNLAEQVLRGLKDETLLVKVTARALEEADA